jgi:hypothetical protein
MHPLPYDLVLPRGVHFLWSPKWTEEVGIHPMEASPAARGPNYAGLPTVEMWKPNGVVENTPISVRFPTSHHQGSAPGSKFPPRYLALPHPKGPWEAGSRKDLARSNRTFSRTHFLRGERHPKWDFAHAIARASLPETPKGVRPLPGNPWNRSGPSEKVPPGWQFASPPRALSRGRASRSAQRALARHRGMTT